VYKNLTTIASAVDARRNLNSSDHAPFRDDLSSMALATNNQTTKFEVYLHRLRRYERRYKI